MIEKEWMDLLACPVCKGAVELRGEEVICAKCKKAYPVKSDIPVMLIEEAKDII